MLVSVSVVLALTVLACGFSASTANIKDAWMSAQEDGSQRNTGFQQSDTFYSIVELANAADDTTVKAVWTAVDAEGAAPNTLIDETEITQGSSTITFNLSPSQLWARGTYKVDLYLEEELDRTLEFEVEGEVPANPTEAPLPESDPATGAVIENAWLTSNEDGSNPTTVFEQNDTFYYVVILTNAPEDTYLKAVWTAVDVDGLEPNTYIEETDITHGSDTITFNLTSNDAWAPGIYKVELYLNGELDRSIEFEVQDEGIPETSGAVEITNVYMALDEDGAQPTKSFGPDQEFNVIAEVANAPADALVTAQWYIVEVEGEEPYLVINESEIEGAYESYSFSLTNDGPWPTGVYGVDIYVNGELLSEVSFEVN
ncbi:hypothetical protein ACFLUC_04045 [Chloroflexota bacterium]